tara:strand:+ start:6267 stop:6989 length:723 start_codon:yes stop_codon:yes gene_type:complete
MLLRSNNTYDKNVCCRKGNTFYFKYELFNDKCSECFKKSCSDEEYKKVIKPYHSTNWKNKLYSKEELNEYANGNILSDNHTCIKMIEFIFDKNLIVRNTMNPDAFFNCICHLKKEKEFNGISAKQAGRILMNYRIKNKTLYDKNQNLQTHIQHAVCGMVIDWWNLKSDEVGGVGYCYYSMGNKPYYYDDNHEKKEIDEPPFNIIKNITLDKFMEIGVDKRKRFEMWLQYSKLLSNTSYVY